MDLVDTLNAWPGAVALRQSGTFYLFVNAAHVLGIGLLIGAALPLDLRLLGAFADVPIGTVGPMLSRSAAIGLALAVATGAWLFTVNPRSYLANPAFLWKLGLLGFALANVAAQHLLPGYGAALSGVRPGLGVRLRAGLSVLAWLAVLLAGRWIGFA